MMIRLHTPRHIAGILAFVLISIATGVPPFRYRTVQELDALPSYYLRLISFLLLAMIWGTNCMAWYAFHLLALIWFAFPDGHKLISVFAHVSG